MRTSGLALAVLRLTRKQLAVRNATLGVSWFWFVGTVITANLPTYAEANLGSPLNNATLYIFALALFSVGTGVGSLLCEKLSSRTVEIGLVPLGSFGMTAFLVDLYFARSGAAPVTVMPATGEGVEPLVVVPLPSRPSSLRPQHSSSPEVLNAQVRLYLEMMRVTSCSGSRKSVRSSG